jgi:hypothetical protein
MSKRAPYEVPTGLKEGQQRFTEWRSSHSGRRPIPEPLWALATQLARQHGILRTAQVLRLDYTKLKRQMQAAEAAAAPVSALPAAFVELVAPASQQMCACTIEVEGPRGRMRIEWKSSAPPDLAGLSRMLWESGE